MTKRIHKYDGAAMSYDSWKSTEPDDVHPDELVAQNVALKVDNERLRRKLQILEATLTLAERMLDAIVVAGRAS